MTPLHGSVCGRGSRLGTGTAHSDSVQRMSRACSCHAANCRRRSCGAGLHDLRCRRRIAGHAQEHVAAIVMYCCTPKQSRGALLVRSIASSVSVTQHVYQRAARVCSNSHWRPRTEFKRRRSDRVASKSRRHQSKARHHLPSMQAAHLPARAIFYNPRQWRCGFQWMACKVAVIVALATTCCTTTLRRQQIATAEVEHEAADVATQHPRRARARLLKFLKKILILNCTTRSTLQANLSYNPGVPETLPPRHLLSWIVLTALSLRWARR